MTAPVSKRSAKALPFSQLCDLLDKLRLDPKSLSNPRQLDAERHDMCASHANSSGAHSLLEPSDRVLEQLEFMNGRFVQPVLASLLPRSSCWDDARPTDSKSRKEQLSLAYLKLLTYTATNNFAGFGLTGVKDETALFMMYEYLQPMMSALLQSNSGIMSILRPLSSIPSLKPMAETYFRCAIEAGDVRAVASLCSSSDLRIDPNEQICVVERWRYTPIERSAKLQHLALTQLLIRMGVDVNKTAVSSSDAYSARPGGCVKRRTQDLYFVQLFEDWDECQPSGALEYALGTCGQTTNKTTELVRTLLRAGAQFHACLMAIVLRANQVELFKLLIRERIKHCCSDWIRSGILHQAVYSQDRETVRFLFEHMQSAGADIDHVYRMLDVIDGHSVDAEPRDFERVTIMDDDKCIWMTPSHPRTFIDIVALRGDILLFRALLRCEPCITDNTLTAAVRSRNKELVELVLDMGASTVSFSNLFHTTPYAEAIRSGDTGLLQLIQSRGGSDNIDTEFPRCAALSAAAEVGNVNLVTDLLERPGSANGATLGYALTKAVNGNHTVSANLLLEAGASTSTDKVLAVLGCQDGGIRTVDIEQHDDCRALFPLTCAINNRNAVLVRLLLEHDAQDPHLGESTTMELAVRWGDISILHDLITASADDGIVRDKSGPIEAAVTKRDFTALQLLLNAGFTINRHHYHEGRDPLMIAVETGDIELVQELLDHGADPRRSRALTAALNQSRGMLMFLIGWIRRYCLDAKHNLEKLLHTAIWEGHIDVVRMLLVSETDNGWESERPEACNGLAAVSNRQATYRVEAGQRSVWHRVSPDAICHYPSKSYDRYRWPLQTAMLVAIQTRNLEVVQLLVNSGADIDLPAKRGVKRTPLQQAVEEGSYAIVKYLLEQRADVNAPPAMRGGGTALQLAAIGGYVGILELLLDNGADVGAAKAVVNGRYPIEGAAEHGRFDMVQYILDLGAYDTEQLRTAVRLANKHGHSAIAENLEDVLAKVQVDQEIEATEDTGIAANSLQHICNTCQKTFSNASSKARHMRTVHGGSASRNQYVCDVCSAGFRRKDLMQRHKADKHEDSKVPCQWCGGKYRKDYLKQHEGPCQQRQPEAMELD